MYVYRQFLAQKYYKVANTLPAVQLIGRAKSLDLACSEVRVPIHH